MYDRNDVIYGLIEKLEIKGNELRNGRGLMERNDRKHI